VTSSNEPSAKRRRIAAPEAPVLIAIPTAQNITQSAEGPNRTQRPSASPITATPRSNNLISLSDNEEDEEEETFSNWIITTPAQIAQTEYASSARSKSKRKSRPVDPSPRLANRAKRKVKRRVVISYVESDGDGNSNSSEDYQGGERESPETTLTTQDGTPNSENLTPNQAAKKRRKARARAETPEGAELVTIVPSIVTMFELASRDRRTGHKSEREKKMRQIDWAAVKQRRKDEEFQMAMKGRKSTVKERAAAEEDSDQDLDQEAQLQKLFAKTAKDKTTKSGIQIRLVNGQQVIDEQSQRVDFHALANQDLAELEEVEEDDITKRFNAQTYINMKRREPAERIPNREKWGDETTDKFYECLSRYGTDFMIISNMFPGKSRRQIRAKFVKEERENPTKIKEALLGTSRRNWDMEHFKQETGLQDTDFKNPREVEEELRKQRETREAEIEAARVQTAENKRQRRLIGALSSDEDEDEPVAKPASKPLSRVTEVIEIIDDEEEED
jgi:transcription factor TFIIIB component B''